LTGGTVYTYSVFAKANGYSKIRVQNFSAGVRAQFDLSTGTLINQSGTTSTFITPYGNGWYRVGFTYTQATTVSAYWNLLVVSTDDNSGSAPAAWAGNGTSSVAFWGSQIEAGAYPTSYVKTEAAAVTRLADGGGNKTSASALIGQTEGTMYLEFYANQGTSSPSAVLYGIFDSTAANNRIQIVSRLGNLQAYIEANSVLYAFPTFAPITAGTTFRLALAYSSAGVVAYVNGASVYTNASALAFTATLATISIGSRGGIDTFGEGEGIAQALLFKTRLSNAKLAELTSL
jgi:hypothetical protein